MKNELVDTGPVGVLPSKRQSLAVSGVRRNDTHLTLIGIFGCSDQDVGIITPGVERYLDSQARSDDPLG